MKRSRPVSLALVGLFVWVTGCHSYTQVGVGELSDYRTVRVTLTSGEREEVQNPGVVAGRIRGETDDGFVAFLPDSVAKIEAKSTNVPLTIVAVLGGLVVLAVSVVALACAVGESDCVGYSCIC